MSRRVLVTVLAFAGFAATAVVAFPPPDAGKDDEHKHHAPKVSPALDGLKSLAGEWEMVDEKGQKHLAATFRVVASGSAVCQTMFPGSEHEMVNMYHMDGDKVVMTHYCASGNQPRMTCAKPEGGVYVFKLQSVSNLKDPNADYMGDLTLTIKDKDSYTEDWTGYSGGKKSAEQMPAFKYTRKK